MTRYLLVILSLVVFAGLTLSALASNLDGKFSQLDPTEQQLTIEAAVAERLGVTATAQAAANATATIDAAIQNALTATAQIQATEASEATIMEAIIQTAIQQTVQATVEAERTHVIATQDADAVERGLQYITSDRATKVVELGRIHSGRISGNIAFSPNSSTLAVASSTGIWIHDVHHLDSDSGMLLNDRIDSVSALLFSPDGTLLALASDDGSVQLWDVITRTERAVWQTGITAVAFSPDGELIALGTGRGNILLWDVTSETERTVLVGHESTTVFSLAFSPDGELLASASRDGTVRLWDILIGQERLVLTGHSQSVATVTFSPDGAQLASSSFDNTVRLWDTMTGKNRVFPTDHEGGISSVEFSSDGARLATVGYYDGSVRLWDLETEKQLAVLPAFTRGNSSGAFNRYNYVLKFSPDGTLLSAPTDDGIVHLLDVATGTESAVLTGHPDVMTSLAFSPDGTLLASATNDTVILWGIPH